MLQPKKRKYRKEFRGKVKGKAGAGTELELGEYGLKAITGGWITSRQIEAARKAIVHYTKRTGRTYIRVFPDKPVTSKPTEVKMGGGKGEVVGYVAVVKRGKIIFELSGVEKEMAVEALRRASYKIGLKTKIVKKE